VDQGKEDNQGITIIPPEKFKTATVTATDKVQVPLLNKVKRGIMNLIHDHPSAGHPGHDETLRKMQERYYWPGMKEWITDYIKGCATCQQNKILTHRKQAPTYCIPTKPNT
jgi:hypothetical protein